MRGPFCLLHSFLLHSEPGIVKINMMFLKLIFLGCLLPISTVLTDIVPDPKPKLKQPNEKQETLPPCQACKTLVDSFKKGLEQTSRNKYEGGDASWEESRLGTYSNSEIRLVEIQEKLCSEVGKVSEQCLLLAEQHEPLIEEWWFKQKNSTDIFNFMCIEKLKVCCPESHYGPDCKPCFGGIVNPCNNHGQCKGAGTRKGSGLCRCYSGYTGDLCEKCKVGYYNDTSKKDWVCSKCDKSCKGHCREAGSKGCEVCADGYHYLTDLGCFDIDECIESTSPVCKLGTFCVNSIGSYQCIECDKSCNGCKGDGPDMCDKCADGYVFQDSICIENKVWKRAVHVEVSRYATYFGLCLATYIIFKRNVYMASLIGLFVGVYIGLSEYTVGEWDKRSFVQSIRSLLLL